MQTSKGLVHASKGAKSIVVWPYQLVFNLLGSGISTLGSLGMFFTMVSGVGAGSLETGLLDIAPIYWTNWVHFVAAQQQIQLRKKNG